MGQYTLAYKFGAVAETSVALKAAIREGLETVCETRRTRASFRRGPGGFDDGWFQRYSTSMVMVWLAALRSWSSVAPLTVIWCVPLLRPLNAPVKPL